MCTAVYVQYTCGICAERHVLRSRVIQLLSVHGHAGGGTSAVKLTTRRKIFDLHLGGNQSWVFPANRDLIWATHLRHHLQDSHQDPKLLHAAK